MISRDVTARMAMPIAASAGIVNSSHEKRRRSRASSLFPMASTILGSQYNWANNRASSRNAANAERTVKRFPQSVVKI